ncbi:MAG TPA: hypothetical protein VFX70_07085 [Mycobacteriales bacterium]|nr:hypothetical protein [Mycobacteriales bacterium]
MIHQRLALALFLDYRSDLLKECRRPDQIANAYLGERGGDQFSQIAARFRDRGDPPGDWLTAGCVDRSRCSVGPVREDRYCRSAIRGSTGPKSTPASVSS